MEVLVASGQEFVEPLGYEILDNVVGEQRLFSNLISGNIVGENDDTTIQIKGRTNDKYVVSKLVEGDRSLYVVDKELVEKGGFNPDKFTWKTTKEILSRYGA